VGQDVNGFCAIMRAAGHDVTVASIPVSSPRLEDLRESARAETLRLYRALGGGHDSPKLSPGPWDIVVDKVIVELDEELHFNRYRRLTLESPSYSAVPAFPMDLYRRFCTDHEAVCLKHGSSQGRWMNPSTEGHFGPSGPRGDLSGAGASRWRQRALYDFMKDVAPHPLPMARIAIWDVIPGTSGVTVGAATNGPTDAGLAAGLWELILIRASNST
jgi:hypothetical protein